MGSYFSQGERAEADADSAFFDGLLTLPSATLANGTYSYLLSPDGLTDDLTEDTPNISSTSKKKKELCVLIHGIGHYSFSWRNYEQRFLQQGYHVLTYDLIGRGHSSYAASGKFGLEEHTAQLLQLLLFHHVSQTFDAVHLVGHSQGAAVAMGFSSQNYHNPLLQGKLESVTLLSPAGVLQNTQLDLLQSSAFVQRTSRFIIMGIAAQVDGWTKEYQDVELAQRNLRYWRGLHADKNRSARVVEAIWRVLLEFPMTKMASHAEKLALLTGDAGTLFDPPTAEADEGAYSSTADASSISNSSEQQEHPPQQQQNNRPISVGVIWGDNDETTPYQEGLSALNRIFTGSDETAQQLQRPVATKGGRYQARTISGCGHETTNDEQFCDEIFAAMMSFQQIWRKL